MKKNLLILVVIVLACFSCNDDDYLSLENTQSKVAMRFDDMDLLSDYEYYYYNGHKMPLSIDKSTCYACEGDYEDVSYVTTSSSPILQTPVKKSVEKKEMYQLAFKKVTLQRNINPAKMSKNDIISINEKTKYVSPCFKNADGEDFYVLPQFYVKVSSPSDSVLLKKMAESYGLLFSGKIHYMDNWYKIICPSENTIDAITYSNLFYESGKFIFATPAFVFKVDVYNSNPLYQYQWGLENTGQYGGVKNIDISFNGALAISSGYNVNVAVIDFGIDYSHPDINNALYSYDAYKDEEHGMSCSIYYSSGPGGHGSACAGIISAKNNDIGIVGVAPMSQVVGISVPLTLGVVTPEVLARAFAWACQKGIQVISCSWGGEALRSDLLTDAISNAVKNGRQGKGCIVVFSTGNNNSSSIIYPSSLSDVISVGAIDMEGKRKNLASMAGENWGSNYGNGLDVVAPGVTIATTDITGSLGFNTNAEYTGSFSVSDFQDYDYTRFFNGTSAATPFVAGVAALILSKNSDLTQKEVRNIIESTCIKLPNYSYSTSLENGKWNNETGYGLINAFAAVSKAVLYPNTYEIDGDDFISTSGSAVYRVKGHLPSNAGVQWSIDSNDFILNTLSSTVCQVTAKNSGKSTMLKAEIITGNQILYTLQKKICSK